MASSISLCLLSQLDIPHFEPEWMSNLVETLRRTIAWNGGEHGSKAKHVVHSKSRFVLMNRFSVKARLNWRICKVPSQETGLRSL
jgi:hypothetical protein